MNLYFLKTLKPTKILTLLLLIISILCIGMLAYTLFRITPKNISFSNISSSSITVSWTTATPTQGVAIAVEKGSKYPIYIPLFSEKQFYDTRDIRKAELEKARLTQESIEENNSFSVKISNFKDTVSIKQDSYYTHHVEITGLDPNKEYQVFIGDRLILKKATVDSNNIVKTKNVPSEIASPSPAYGSIKDANHQDLPMEDLIAVKDAVVLVNYWEEFSNDRSDIFSSPLTSEGKWYIDISSAQDSLGVPFLEKYSKDSIFNLWIELTVEAGPLGKWKKVIPSKLLTPAETIVINDPKVVDTDNPIVLQKLQSLGNLIEKTVKGAQAMEDGCLWISYCGCGKSVGGSWVDCDCDPSILASRHCGSQISAGEAVQEVIRGGCSGGAASEGQVTKVNGICKECIGGYWKTPNAGVECEDELGEQVIGNPVDRERDPEIVECPLVGDRGIRDVPEGDRCKCVISASRGGASVGYRDESGDCVAETTERECPLSGYNGIQDTAVDGNCRCALEPSDIAGQGVTYGSRNSSGICVQEVTIATREGESCTNPAENILNGIINSAGECVERTGEEILTATDIIGNACWDNSSRNLYLQVRNSEGELITYECTRDEGWTEVTRPTYVCELGHACNPGLFGVFGSNDMCLNGSGVLLDCNGGVWEKEEGATERAAINVAEVSPGDICNNETGCVCSSSLSKYVSNGDYCIEALSCAITAAGPTGTISTPINNGKVCNRSGNTCSAGVCNGASAEGRSIKDILSKRVFAEETIQEYTDYIVDQSTGLITDIQPGLYTFRNQGKTYAFIIKEQDVQDDRKDILIYIDENNNGTYDKETEKKISDLGSQIKVQTITQSYPYELKEGYNFISIPFLINDPKARTAAGLLKMINDLYSDSVYSIAKYNGNWKIVGENVEVYDTNDFQLVPGQGYIIKAKRNTSVSILGRPIRLEGTDDSAPISLYMGWNLIGIYGSGVKAYTAKSLIESINNYQNTDFTADNVSRWDSQKQLYDGLQIDNVNGENVEYGFDFPLNIQQSYFVKIIKGEGNWQLESK